MDAQIRSDHVPFLFLVLTLRILQAGLAPKKAFIPLASLVTIIMGLASKPSRLNGPLIELFNITFNPWHTKANNLHFKIM